MITLTQIEYAVAVHRKGSFLAAAKACHVTQPSLSMQIQKLEDLLEVRLFDRSRKPIKVTQIGEAFLKQFMVILQEVGRLEQIRFAAKEMVAGPYRLGIIPTLAPYVLPLLLPEFQKTFPEVQLSVRELTTPEIVAALKVEELDGGILAIPLNDPELNEIELFDEPFCVFAAGGMARGLTSPKIRLRELPLEKIVMLSEGHCLRTQIIDFCALAEDTVERGFSLEAGSVNTLIRMVEKTDSFTILPKLALADLSPKRQKEQVFEFNDSIPYRRVGLITHRAEVKAAIDKALSEVVKAVIPDEIVSFAKSNGQLMEPV